MRKAGIANAPRPSLEAPGTSHISYFYFFFLHKHDRATHLKQNSGGQGLPSMGPEEVYWACTQLNSHIPNPSDAKISSIPLPCTLFSRCNYYKTTEPSKSEAIKATMNRASSNPPHLRSAPNHRTFLVFHQITVSTSEHNITSTRLVRF